MLISEVISLTVKIITDSASDLTDKHFTEWDIEMLPLSVHLDGKDYKDGVSIAPKTVYDAMRQGKETKTSQVSPQTFKETFTKYAKEDQDFVYIAFSSQLSGTYQTAKMIEQEVKEEFPNANFHIIDTKCASMGQGLVVLTAAKLAKEGASMEKIIEEATYQAEHMEQIFTVDDLEYLRRGGRVSKTQAFVGSLLKIKPLLHVEDGKLIPLEKIRGAKKVLGRMIEVMEERGTNFENQRIAITHGDDLERAEKLASLITDKFQIPKENIEIEMVGAVIGAHAGPGTIALFFS